MYSLSDSDPRSSAAAVDVISREIAQIYSRGHERAPDAARTVWNDDVVVCVLDGVLTEGERKLVAQGRFEWMRAERLARHETLAPGFRAAIERLTERPVRAQMTEVGPEDVAFEVFILA
jgi:uncharacterized protein YbcI